MQVLLISENLIHLKNIEMGLRRDQNIAIAYHGIENDWLTHCRQSRPDIVIIYATSPSEKLLREIKHLDHVQPIPIIMYTQDPDEQKVNTAMAANVSAYVIDGLHSERIHSIIAVARARFAVTQKLKASLKESELRLESRKVIERAKGIIMQQRHCTEDEAYKLLRTTAMNLNKSLAEVALTLTAVDAIRLQPK